MDAAFLILGLVLFALTTWLVAALARLGDFE